MQRRSLLGKKKHSSHSDAGSQEERVEDSEKLSTWKKLWNLISGRIRDRENRLKGLDVEDLDAAAHIMLLNLRQTDKLSSLRSAKKFHARGVTFKKSRRDDGLLGVRFHKGVLYLPELVLNKTLEVVLMNMVAFEIMYPASGNEITSFMSFMDTLIDTAEDISILGDAGVITNNLESDEAAASIFNRLGNRGMCNPFDEVMRQVQKHASYSPRRWWVHFKHTYLANPWTILSLIGALLLLFLTATQTIYAVLSFYQHK